GYRVTRAASEQHLSASFDAEQVVVAAGGWLPDLLDALDLPEGYRAGFPALEVRQEQAYHFPYREASSAGTWPTFIHK
ncbi:sarcosine oxidase, partial [Bacillus sp. S34]|nr:sarcosine oxidase [Bacillus sp. S34]